MANKNDKFKKRAILIQLRKNFPEETISDALDFRDNGHQQGCSIALQINGKNYYCSEYTAKADDILEIATSMIQQLKKGYKEVLENGIFDKKFMLDQLAIKHINNPDIFKYDTNLYQANSTMQVVEEMMLRAQTVEEMLNEIDNEARNAVA